MKPQKKLIGLGVVTAVLASLCCIAPILALLAGTTGLISTFSWLGPVRPYLIAITILVLGFAWYQKLRPQTTTNCNCDPNEKITFFRTKKFLGIVTIFAALMLAFPMYATVFYPKQMTQTIAPEKTPVISAEFKISGMTCADCEDHVNYEVNKLHGIISAIVSYDSANAIVKFDPAKTGINQIKEAINHTGYFVTEKKIIK